MIFRVGIGQDSHRFIEEDNQKALILGGVELSSRGGLLANSDGDVIIHALCNAIEQALGSGSFSTYADTMCEAGVTDSQKYLEVALSHVQEKGFQINNVGISIEAKRPKITPVFLEIRKNISQLLNISEENIGINATSGEGLTSFGRGEGIQVIAIVSLIKD